MSIKVKFGDGEILEKVTIVDFTETTQKETE